MILQIPWEEAVLIKITAPTMLKEIKKVYDCSKSCGMNSPSSATEYMAL